MVLYFQEFKYKVNPIKKKVLGKNKKIKNKKKIHNKGVLASSHNKYVAVKKLDNMVRYFEREFKTKLIVIGQKLANLKNNKKG